MSEPTMPEQDLGPMSRDEMMSALFAQLVVQQSNMAMLLMGKVPHPQTGKTVRDVEAARLFIDQLEMLEAKTKGNLTKEEDQLLKQSLMALRMSFVDAVESPAPESKTPEAAAPSAENKIESAPTSSSTDERTAELREFLMEPVAALGFSVRVHGVGYPDDGKAALAATGIEFAGYVANFRVPQAFAAARMTVHVPRRPYVEALPGIPTIRVFEALACGIPLVSAPWVDCEGLFTPGTDFLSARAGDAMRRHLAALRADPAMAAALAAQGRATILARHTCAHRVDELLAICRSLGRDLRASHMAAAQ